MQLHAELHRSVHVQGLTSGQAVSLPRPDLMRLLQYWDYEEGLTSMVRWGVMLGSEMDTTVAPDMDTTVGS